MSADGRRSTVSRATAIAAALLLWAGPLLAAPAEVPRVEAPVGSGSSSSASGAGAAVLAPTLAPSGFAPVAAPALAPAAVLAAPAAAPSVPLAASALAPAPAAAAALAAPAAGPVRPDSPAGAASAPAAPPRAVGGFGKRVAASQPADPAEPAAAADAAWSRGAALFDLSAEPAAGATDAVPAAPAGNETAQTLARLRRAGERGQAGPGSIPGMARAEWAGRAGGYSGETGKVLIDGKPWFLKRLGSSPDPDIAATPRETRALNEAGFASVLRGDPLLSRSFAVSPRVSVFRDGREVYVLSEGLPAVGDGESKRHELSALQRADASIVQLVLGMGDMHGADVLPLGGGRFGLIDFEKLSRAPLEKAALQQIDSEIMMKNFPLVDRLSANDPAVYRARFEAWRDQYAGGGRARMDAALAAAGWTPAQRQVYLAAVDKNLETYLERLQPYLDYANEWHRKISAARAEAARPPPRKGFWGGLFGSDPR